ncbi:MAG: MFS transporter [Chlamydiae bacterium]|nr:MFS transporter [Chlamydiota bacterium]
MYKVFLPYVRIKVLLVLEAILFGMGVIICAFLHERFLFVAVLGASVMIASFGWPLCTGIISNAVYGEMQGKILGLSQSVQSLAMMLGPLIVAPFLSKDSLIPFFIAAGFSLVFGILVLLTKIQEHFHPD